MITHGRRVVAALLSLGRLPELDQRLKDLENARRDIDRTVDGLERDVDELAALVGEFTTKPTGRPATRGRTR